MFCMKYYVNEVIDENLSYQLNCVGMQKCVFTDCFDLLYDPNIWIYDTAAASCNIAQDMTMDSSIHYTLIQK